MGMTNAERQAKHRQRVKAQVESLRNTADGDVVALRNRIGELEATLAAAHARIAELERLIPRKRITFVPDDDSITAIRDAMKQRGISRGTLARELGIPNGSLGMYLTRKQTLAESHMAKVRAALGLE